MTKVLIRPFWLALLLFCSPLPAATVVVNSLADPGTGVCDVTECTLREAFTFVLGVTQRTLFLVFFSICFSLLNHFFN